MKIAKIVNSNSHIDYVGRVIDRLDSTSPPISEDYGFAQFAKIQTEENKEIVGIIYNSVLVNPEYSNFGPRLSSNTELMIVSPDLLNEQGILLSILLLGSIENGQTLQGVPRRIIPAGKDIVKMEKDEILKFHTDKNGGLQIHYYSQIVAHTGFFAVPLIEAIIEQLSEGATEEDKNRLNVLRKALSWQRTVGGMRL